MKKILSMVMVMTVLVSLLTMVNFTSVSAAPPMYVNGSIIIRKTITFILLMILLQVNSAEKIFMYLLLKERQVPLLIMETDCPVSALTRCWILTAPIFCVIITPQ